jgi:hypothetical protein
MSRGDESGYLIELKIDVPYAVDTSLSMRKEPLVVEAGAIMTQGP